MRDLTNLTADELRDALLSDTMRLREALDEGDHEFAEGLQYVLQETRDELARRGEPEYVGVA